MSWWEGVGGGGLTSGASAASAPATSGFDWSSLIDVGGDVLGSVLPAYFANQSANKSTDAITGANQQAIDLQRQIYNDQIRRTEPWRQSGFNALNFQNLWLGMPQVKDSAGTTTITDPNAPSAANNWGAGQPVAGHTGGGGSNPLTSAIGAGVGNYFGGPIGGAIGGALGGLIRKGGDNWTTLATGAPEGFNYDKYVSDNPGLLDDANGWAKADVRSLFNNDRNAYLYWHYNTFGKNEGRKLDPLDGYSVGSNGLPVQSSTGAGTTTGTGTTATGTSGTPDLWSTIKANPLYVAATEGFLGIDKPQVEGAFATGGQALSGAEKKSLFDRGTARSYNALGDIYNQFAGLSGTGYTAAGSQNNSGANFANGASNLIVNSGQAQADKSTAVNNNWATAGNNILSNVYDYGKKSGWIN